MTFNNGTRRPCKSDLTYHGGRVKAAFFVCPKVRLAVIVLTNGQGTRPESLGESAANKKSRKRTLSKISALKTNTA